MIIISKNVAVVAKKKKSDIDSLASINCEEMLWLGYAYTVKSDTEKR